MLPHGMPPVIPSNPHTARRPSVRSAARVYGAVPRARLANPVPLGVLFARYDGSHPTRLPVARKATPLSSPAAAETKPVPVGALLTCPAQFAPHATSVPFERTATAWAPPAATETKSFPAGLPLIT